MASTPSFIGTPKLKSLVLNNSNGGDSAYVSPTTIATVLTMGVTGGRVDNIYIQPAGTNASCVVRLWVDTVGTGGTNNFLINEQPVPATTSSSVAALTNPRWSPGLVLPANAVLRATVANTAVTNGVVVSVEYGEF